MAKKTHSWRTVRAELRLDEVNVARHKERMLAEVHAYELAELRREQRTSQEGLAKVMKVSQSRISRIERGELDRSELGTLRAYVEALGGKLGVVATFGDRTIVLR